MKRQLAITDGGYCEDINCSSSVAPPPFKRQRINKFDIEIDPIYDSGLLMNCNSVYLTLLEVLTVNYGDYGHHVSLYSKLIAEFAATATNHCIGCQIEYKYTECIHDYSYSSSITKACFDEDDNIRYYINFEPDLVFDTDRTRKVEIICQDCCKKWKCSTCQWQALEQDVDNGNLDECIVCKSCICIDCCNPTKFGPNDTISIQFNQRYSICDRCHNDPIINNSQYILRKMLQSKINFNELVYYRDL